MEYLDIGPLKSARGSVTLPGSKSISNRTLLLAALSHGETEIRDLLASDDVDRMLDSLGRLGVKVVATERGEYLSRERGRAAFRSRMRICSSATPARRFARSPPRWRSRRGATRCPACRACTSGRSAIWWTGCARWVPTSVTWATKAFRRSRFGRRRSGVRRCDQGARRCIEPVSDRLVDGAAPLGGETTIEVVGELISKPYVAHHPQPDGAFRRGGRTRRLDALHDSSGGALYQSRARSTSRAMLRPPRIFWPPAQSAADR